MEWYVSRPEGSDPLPSQVLATKPRTMQVRAYHNVERDRFGRPLGMLDGYQAARDRLVLVYEANWPVTKEVRAGAAHLAVCEKLFTLLNVGDDPEFGEPDATAVEYRGRGNRSLSVGDVVSIDGRFYTCASIGFEPIDVDPIIVEQTMHGTTPLTS